VLFDELAPFLVELLGRSLLPGHRPESRRATLPSTPNSG
jgi:hypothetical protein